MMKKVFLLLGFVGLMASCSVDDNNEVINYEAARVVDFELPDSLDFGKRYQFPVRFIRPTNCSEFYGFDARRADSTRFVYPINVVYERENCQDTPTDTASAVLNFEVIYDYSYIFKFYTGVDTDGEPTFVSDTIPVRKAN